VATLKGWNLITSYEQLLVERGPQPHIPLPCRNWALGRARIIQRISIPGLHPESILLPELRMPQLRVCQRMSSAPSASLGLSAMAFQGAACPPARSLPHAPLRSAASRASRPQARSLWHKTPPGPLAEPRGGAARGCSGAPRDARSGRGCGGSVGAQVREPDAGAGAPAPLVKHWAAILRSAGTPSPSSVSAAAPDLLPFLAPLPSAGSRE